MLKSVVFFCIVMWHEMYAFSSHAEQTKTPSMPLVRVERQVADQAAGPCPPNEFTVNANLETWGRARLLCAMQGDHLATINSAAEETAVVKLLAEKLLDEAWIGYHDIFFDGAWVSVFDEPLQQLSWERWSNQWPNLPDGGNLQNCGALIRKGHGMDDQLCNTPKPYICRKSAPRCQ